MRHVFLSIAALGLAVACAPAANQSQTAPGAAAKTPSVEELTGGPWRVVSINGAPVDTGASMEFGSDGRVSGNASCNRYSAAFKLDGANLSLEQAISTMMACVEGNKEEVERRFLTTLAEVERAEIAPDGSLVLHARNNGQIVARRT
jgi:heat shock protein HslJ